MKQIIPSELRVGLRVFQRYLSDLMSGELSHFSIKATLDREEQYKSQITISQSLGSMSQYQLDCKKHNLEIAIQKIQDAIICPGQIFSFWHMLGCPNKAAGYVEGRTIKGEQVAPTLGGGLCQLSGLLYFLSLKAGFAIVERHPHSKDIYTDATRFAPLGSDATVVYGYKDLRFKNTLDVDICFRIAMDEKNIYASLCSLQALTEFRIYFKSISCEAGIRVDTFRSAINDDKVEWISSSTYPKLTVPVTLN